MNDKDPTEPERRLHERYPATSIAVDYSSGDNFLFSYLSNISEMGIFIRTDDPLPVGTELKLRFGEVSMNGSGPLQLTGVVTWINPVRAPGGSPNAGMGVKFLELSPQQREAVVHLVRTVAYLQRDSHSIN